uniref:Protein containing DUF1239 n=1 Tax=uncultured microorganism TaxID=358574 RepID=F8UHY9_9ZZZZ|nr:protein containing DUF1239 [uncultured microorganism]
MNPLRRFLSSFKKPRNSFCTESEAGKPKWDIRAQSAAFASSGEASLSKVEINLYKEGKKVITVRSDKGVYDKASQSVVLEGNVFGLTNEGQSFSTRRLEWDAARGKISTQDPVKITGNNVIINGRGLEFSSDLKKIVLKKNVTVEITGGADTIPLKFGR